ncbi:MAG: hypothetical protein ABSH08_13495 [Tepidisphaeraceae bacterium]|jgi:hypothetical protein
MKIQAKATGEAPGRAHKRETCSEENFWIDAEGQFVWIGKASGSFVYLRNIIWILEGKRLDAVPATQAADPMPES